MNDDDSLPETTARLARSKNIFLSVREMPLSEREDAIDQACDGDTKLQSLVLELLAGESMPLPVETLADDIRAAHDVMLSTTHGEPQGSMIDNYRLVERIGEGGFGVVFAAEQTKPVKRRVALKIIKLGMDTRKVIARFEAERQALALMEHPGIAKVLDAGATKTGRPYFVMELVKGLSITTYCDQNQLTIREHLELFVQVCNAVQHAHTKGIIHRDLKPSNVLVTLQDGNPHTKIIDFGVAKATSARLTEQTIYTEHRQLIGTPEYMSPEQAAGSMDIDTRTDIYSLGVLLYELLTGTTPFSDSDMRSVANSDIQRLIQDVDPIKPSTRLSRSHNTLATIAAKRRTEPRKLNTLVRGELDWIAMKAMDKDRQRRYQTAAALGMDAERYLIGNAIVAAPPGAIYKLKKFVRRNLVAVTAASFVTLTLIGGVIAFAWQAKVAQRQRDAAIKASTRAQTISEFVTSLLQLGDARTEMGSENMTVLAALQHAIKDIDSEKFKNDPEVQATLKSTIAVILQTYSKDEQAEKLYEESLATLQQHFQGDHPAVAKALGQLGYIRFCRNRFEEAELLSKQSVDMYKRLNLGDHEDVADAMNGLAIARSRNHLAESLAMTIQSLEMLQRLHPGDDVRVAGMMCNVGDVQITAGQFIEAEQTLTKSLEMNRHLYKSDNASVAMNLAFLGTAKLALGKPDEAERVLTESLEMYLRLFDGPNFDVAATRSRLGSAKIALGKTEEAEQLCLAASVYFLNRDHPQRARSLSCLGEARAALGRTVEARQNFDESVAVARRLAPKGSALLSEMLWTSAVVRMREGDAAHALPELREANDIAQRFIPTNHPLREKILATFKDQNGMKR